MDAQQFLAEFSHIVNAPGGVARLRELVLSMAVTGRLVQQNVREQPAGEWLCEVDKMKHHLVRKGQISRPSSFTDVNPNEMPFSPPLGWQFVRLGRISSKLGSGSTPRGGSKVYVSEGIPFLRSQNVWNDGLHLDHVVHITQDTHQNMSGTSVQSNDLLLNITGASLGRCALVPENFGTANVSQHVTIIRLIDPTLRHYLHICLLSPLLQSMIWERQVGMAREGLSKKILEQFEIPLPPLEEQSRIVAKVDELMALCDQLETQQQQRRTLQNHLRQATLQAVATSQSPRELQDSWQRLQTNFGELFSAPEDVAQLRCLILDLAANGYLSEPQDGDSEPLDSLDSAYICQRKEFSVRELREINALPEPMIENGRLRIALGRIIKLVSGQHLAPDKYNTSNVGIPYITGPAEFINGRPSPSKWTFERRAIAKSQDILITVKGSGVGKTAICDIEELAISRQLMAIRALTDMNKNYLAICVDSAERKFQEQKFGIAIPGIGREEVLNLSIVLPSSEEQGRIVNRVDELMRFCDELELNLRNVTTTGERLTTASVATLTGITIEQKEEPMKAPQTELVAPVRLGTPPDVNAQAPLATILARHNGEMSAKDLWQRFGGEIDAFYAQLKTEVTHGWLLAPMPAEVREKTAN